MRDVETFGGGFLVEAMVDHRPSVDPAAAPKVDEGVLIVLGRGEADEADGALALEFEAVGAEVGAVLGEAITLADSPPAGA